MGVLSSPHHSPQHSPCVPSSQCSLLYPSAARRIPTPSDRCWLAALLVVLSLVSAIPELELASLTLLSPTLDIPTPWSTERGRLRLSLSLSLTPSDTVCPRLLGSPTLLCMLSPQLSTTVYIPSTARGRLRPSPTTDALPEFTLPCTTLVSTTVLSDIPDIIPMSTERGRLRPSPSTVTPPELSLTCTTLLLWLPLVSDTLSP